MHVALGSGQQFFQMALIVARRGTFHPLFPNVKRLWQARYRQYILAVMWFNTLLAFELAL